MAIGFFAFTSIVLLRQALGASTVTADIIAGAVCVYLLLGVIWALVFSLIEQLLPGSFLVNGSPFAPDVAQSVLRSELLYLSFITLSTVGYGDVVPAVPSARAFAVLEALTGQLYLTVLVARLVGLHMARRP